MWYSGGLNFDDRSKSVYASVVFLTSSTITHVLATMSANFGIVEKNIFKIAMKSEFSFDVFVPTQLGKHYFACISCQEGLVYDKLKWEIKGAQLKSANAPRPVIAAAEKMMQGIIHDVMERREVSMHQWLDYVADQEIKIRQAIADGSMAYFRSTSIKDAKSYAGPKEQSPYAHHFLWVDVFSPKYGYVPEPPYSTFKINVTTTGPSKMAAWLEGMKDQEMAERIRAYLDSIRFDEFTYFIQNRTGTPNADRQLRATTRTDTAVAQSVAHQEYSERNRIRGLERLREQREQAEADRVVPEITRNLLGRINWCG
jgi:hypothetical protein